MKIRTEEERQQFLKDQDGLTEFFFEDVKMFGKTFRMTKCAKCGNILSLTQLLRYIEPIHCIGCGRIIMEQDKDKFKSVSKDNQI